MKEPQVIKYPAQIVVDALRLTAYVISKACWFIRYTGRENIPPRTSGAFLIAANHQTYIDPVWICVPMRRRIRYIAFDKAFEWRFIGPLIGYLGAIPVKHSAGLSVQTIKDSISALRDGAVLTIFPEGGRAFAGGEMIEFKTGAVRVAQQAGVPLLPVTVRGGNRIWPQKQKYPRLFRRVEIIYHPIFHVTATSNTPEYLTKKLRDIIASGLE